MKVKDFDFHEFEKIRYENEQKHREFLEGKRKVLIAQDWDTCFYSHCNSKEELLSAFLDGYSKAMKMETDHVPYLEPWHGVGVFANAFGCKITWVEGDTPWTSPVFSSVEDIKNIIKPQPKNCEVMVMVLETIRYLKEKTGGVIPICFTDTQSPFDTASLIMEPNSFFTGLIAEPDAMHHFIGQITDIVIEFSKMQRDEIGDILIKPGHIMTSSVNWSGISLSDDNIVMISPQMYGEFSRIYNARIGKEFGGVAIHSCGRWDGSARAVIETEGLTMVDAAFSASLDPHPNDPKMFRECFADTGVVVQVRIDYRELEKAKILTGNGMKTVFQLRGFTGDNSFEIRNEVVSRWRDELSDE